MAERNSRVSTLTEPTNDAPVAPPPGQGTVALNPNWNPCEARLQAIEGLLTDVQRRIANAEKFLSAQAAFVQTISAMSSKGAELLQQFDDLQKRVAQVEKIAFGAYKETRATRKKAGISDEEVKAA
jgi:hypothetical protein